MSGEKFTDEEIGAVCDELNRECRAVSLSGVHIADVARSDQYLTDPDYGLTDDET